jgi:hypothetical protein
MCIFRNHVSSKMLRPKSLEIRKANREKTNSKIECHKNGAIPFIG